MFFLVWRRIFEAVPTLFILIALSFFIIRLTPGSPFIAEKGYPPEVIRNIEAKYHLNEPMLKQFGYYLTGIVHGDFGPSFKYKDYSVNDLLAYALPISVKLGIYSFLAALFLGLLLGITAALKQNSWVDYTVMAVAMTGVVIPSFVTAPLLVLLFAVILHWLPAGGYNDGNFSNLLLPITALAIPYVATIARMMRGSMIEVLHSPFILTAKAKGLPWYLIIGRHALKPALIPVVSYLGPAFVGIITGSVIIEQIFVLPGIGQLFVNGALNRDYGLVMSLTVLVGILTITFNTAVDIIISFLDPRIRY